MYEKKESVKAKMQLKWFRGLEAMRQGTASSKSGGAENGSYDAAATSRWEWPDSESGRIAKNHVSMFAAIGVQPFIGNVPSTTSVGAIRLTDEIVVPMSKLEPKGWLLSPWSLVDAIWGETS